MSQDTHRLAVVLGALSSATDLAAGVPVGTSVRTCLAATRLARRLGLGDEAVRDVYFTALLRHLGCFIRCSSLRRSVVLAPPLLPHLLRRGGRGAMRQTPHGAAVARVRHGYAVRSSLCVVRLAKSSDSRCRLHARPSWRSCHLPRRGPRREKLRGLPATSKRPRFGEATGDPGRLCCRRFLGACPSWRPLPIEQRQEHRPPHQRGDGANRRFRVEYTE